MIPPVRMRARIEAFITQQQTRPICTQCLASALGATKSVIHRVVVMLEGAPNFIRQWVACASCGKLRVAIRRALP